MQARVITMHRECEGILKIVLAPLEGEFPAAEPGAHVDVIVPGQPVRQYSLTAGSDESQYVLGVLELVGRGGASSYIHRSLRVGDVIEIGGPRNAFALVPEGPVLLLAGGIGVTPLLSMAAAMAGTGREWAFHYFCRSRGLSGFGPQVQALGGEMHFDDEEGTPDLARFVADIAPTTHVYCCGPTPMLDAFVLATAHLDPEYVHIERFSATEVEVVEGDRPFNLLLQRRGIEVPVEVGQSVLDALIDAGVDPEFSCRSGLCGQCEVRVLAGDADHRDQLLTEAERAEGAFLACCSRSRSQTLVLDL